VDQRPPAPHFRSDDLPCRERETVQTVVAFADPTDYDAEKGRLTDESRHKSSANSIYLLARRSPEADELVAEICRCQRIVELHRHDPRLGGQEYCQSQIERASRLASELAQKIVRSLTQRVPNLRAVTSQIDPLSLVQMAGGNPTVKIDHKGLVSIKDFIERSGTVEGKRLIDHFSGPPFGGRLALEEVLLGQRVRHRLEPCAR